ncbi:hypothetical protein Taro_014917, partial [Colocasia esculenta]|nr:hypothetical protein [Colocasia esculenta]
MVLWNSITGPKFRRGVCVLVHRLSYPLVRRPNSSSGAWSQAADAIAYGHPFAQTGITFRPVIQISCKTPIQNRHSKAPVTPLSLQTPIWNRHSEAPVAPLSPQAIRCRFGVKKPLFRTPKLQFQPTIFPIPRFSGRSPSLDYMNRWRGQHTESAYHGDWKSCSTRLEISTPAKELGITFRPSIGIANVTTISNRYSKMVD